MIFDTLFHEVDEVRVQHEIQCLVSKVSSEND